MIAKSTRDFAIGLGFLAVLRIVLPFVPVPLKQKALVDFALLIVVFLVTIWSIYRMMSSKLQAKHAALMLIFGVAIHGIGIALSLSAPKGPISIVASAIAQTGLPIWCIGLGALIASLLREKNILIPVAIFLVAWDIFLVLTPLGFTQKLMRSQPHLLQQGGLALPKSQTDTMPISQVTNATAGFVGPADLVFLGVFFLAMFRFDMKPERTFRVMVPVLIAYMIIVLFTGMALPALVPMGLVVLIVNWSEFKLNKDEWAGTGVIAALAAAILIYSATRPKPKPKPPVEPSIEGNVPAPAESAVSPAPVDPNQPRSSTPNAQQNTPSPR